MDSYQKIATELKNYFASNSFFKVLLPIDMIIVYACLGAMALNTVISIGGLLNSIVYYGLLLGLILAFSNQSNKTLFIGLFINAGLKIIQVIKYGIFYEYRFFDFSALLTAAIFGFLGFMVFKYHSKNTQI